MPGVAPPVKLPAESIVPPPATTDHVGRNCTRLPLASFAVAKNCCVAATASVAGFGTTVIVAIAPDTTVIEALPEMDPTVATAVLAKKPAAAPAVNIPLALTVPPRAATDHVGVTAITRPEASRPTAIS